MISACVLVICAASERRSTSAADTLVRFASASALAASRFDWAVASSDLSVPISASSSDLNSASALASADIVAAASRSDSAVASRLSTAAFAVPCISVVPSREAEAIDMAATAAPLPASCRSCTAAGDADAPPPMAAPGLGMGMATGAG